MARITVEDCLDKVDNRFELVMIAAKRARDLSMHGADSELEWENDKPTVMALREIAAGSIDKKVLDAKAPVLDMADVVTDESSSGDTEATA